MLEVLKLSLEALNLFSRPNRSRGNQIKMDWREHPKVHITSVMPFIAKCMPPFKIVLLYLWLSHIVLTVGGGSKLQRDRWQAPDSTNYRSEIAKRRCCRGGIFRLYHGLQWYLSPSPCIVRPLNPAFSSFYVGRAKLIPSLKLYLGLLKPVICNSIFWHHCDWSQWWLNNFPKFLCRIIIIKWATSRVRSRP